MKGRREQARSEARPGFVLAHRGAEIGVLERIEVSELSDITLLHVRGGVSGSLEYIVPSNVVVDVHAASRRACVDDNVTFEPHAIAADGRLILVVAFPGAEEPTASRDPSAAR